MIDIEKERRACAEICHRLYMEYQYGTARTDPEDDYIAGIKAEVAERLRDEIMARSRIAGDPTIHAGEKE